MRRAVSDVDYHVHHFALNYAAELCLRTLDLIVQPAQRALDRSGVVILHEPALDSDLSKLDLLITLEEKPALIFEHRGFDQADTWKRGLNTFHISFLGLLTRQNAVCHLRSARSFPRARFRFQRSRPPAGESLS